MILKFVNDSCVEEIIKDIVEFFYIYSFHFFPFMMKIVSIQHTAMGIFLYTLYVYVCKKNIGLRINGWIIRESRVVRLCVSVLKADAY